MPAAESKASRPAITGLLAKGKVSLPVASPVPSHGRDETFFNWNVSPVRRAGRRHRQNNDDRWRCPDNISSLSLKTPERMRANDDVLRGAARVAPVTRPACAEYMPHNIVIA